MLTHLYLLILIYRTSGVFLPADTVSACYGLECQHGGTVRPEDCICQCMPGFHGLLCEHELLPSAWPSGFYSLLSTVFGCPEPDNHGWTGGFLNLTASKFETGQRHWFPERFRLLGPYHLYSIQLNFCTRNAPEVSDDQVTVWPPGSYCIFKSKEHACLEAFYEDTLHLSGYLLTGKGGMLPEVDDTSTEMKLCCRQDGLDNYTMVLPATFPFYLIKISPDSDCPRIDDTVLTEEMFTFINIANITSPSGNVSNIDEEDNGPKKLNLCYYEPYERRECMYVDDQGASYRGRVNVTADGSPCQRWDSNVYPIQKRNYEGDFDDNYCRQTWNIRPRPYCVINDVTYYCDIPLCDSSDDMPNVIRGKLLRSATARSDTPIRNIVDGRLGKPAFSVVRPFAEPWIQIDLQENFIVYSVNVYKAYNWMPYNNRRLVTYVSTKRWDFLTFGSYTCEGPYNPARVTKFRFQCRRPLIGSFVTIQNFIKYDPYVVWDSSRYFEVSEIVIRGKATGCGKSLGVLSGEVKDFQLQSSTDAEGYYAYHARLNRASGWCARAEDPTPYIQIDLLTPMVMEGIAMQGWTTGNKRHIPDNFTIHFGITIGNLSSYEEFGQAKVFILDKTMAAGEKQIFMLQPPRIVQLVRIYSNQKIAQSCLKFDLIGCPRRVNVLSRCTEDSKTIGVQVMPGHSFFQERYNETDAFLTTEPNATFCRARYLSKTDGWSSYRYSSSDTQCSYLVGNRYSRYNQHWWISQQSLARQYGQVVCLEGVRDIYDCGGNVGSTGVIQSPSYPFYYGANINCTWNIVLDKGTFISLDLIDVFLAAKEQAYDKTAYVDCVDALTIFDMHRSETHIITTVTGYPFTTLENPVYFSSSNELELNLVSCHRQSETSARGFAVAVGKKDCGGCGQGETSCSTQTVCTDHCGYLSSPGFPSNYPVSVNCQWKIQGHFGQYVTVTFTMIDVIASGEGSCEGDYVGLFDLDLSEKRSLIQRYCKRNRPISAISSSWHMLIVEFYSDFETVGRGFSLKYVLETRERPMEAANSSSLCADSWHEYDGRCYGFRTAASGITWLEAEKLCNDEGGHLASINDRKETLFIHSIIINNNVFTEQRMYIGLKKVGSSMFKWTDGHPLSYTDWFTGDAYTRVQPDGLEREECTIIFLSNIITTSDWHDVACAFGEISQYICETENKTVKSREDVDLTQHINITGSKDRDGYYFRCFNTEYISRLFECDGALDCTDGSDEAYCTRASCPERMFRCNDGGCVDIAFYCDYRQQCGDGSDELNCVSRPCNPGEWTCDSGQCVDNDQHCDLILDCADGSDERNCETCREPFFQCYDGHCLPPGRVCDGFVDCGGQYREDEGPQCQTNSRPSCASWYSVGVREDGIYNIVVGDSETYPVECLFNVEEQKTTTTIHHTMEDTTVTSNVLFDQMLQYTIPNAAIAQLMSKSSSCRQSVHIECLHAFGLYDGYLNWYDVNGKKRSFLAGANSNCSCILTDYCNKGNSRCACHKTRTDWFLINDNDWLTDTGSIGNMDILPITRLFADDTLRLARVRHKIGPLICQESVDQRRTSIMCQSGVVVDVSYRCLLNYDIYDQYTGCRDLTHIQDCADFQCPDNYFKCNGSYCIPLRLVCDGHSDCAGGIEEVNCSNLKCPGQFRCHGNSVCLPWKEVCDTVRHCPEGDDERYCNDTCPFNCTCNGAVVRCGQLNRDRVLHLQSYTRVLSFKQTDNRTLGENLFPHMNSLAVLDLSNIGIYEILKDCFSGLDNLKELNLGMNFLKEITIGLFKDLINLKSLVLTGNRIQAIYPGSFLGLSLLPELDMSKLNVMALVENTFNGLTNLMSLNLSGNELRTIEDYAFGGLDKVQYLDLENNYISEFRSGVFYGLSTLTSLRNDKYVLCCFRPQSVAEHKCYPQADEFSSCSDLMRNEILRIVMWILGFVALVGNLVVLASRCIYDRDSLSRNNDFFVANLAISDFLMGVYMIIIASADTYYRGVYSWNDEAWRSSWVCKLAGFTATVSSQTSVLFLCMITLDRVVVIKFPFKDLNTFKKLSKIACALVWVVGVLFAAVPLLPLEYFSGSFYSRSGVCLALPLTRDKPAGWEYSMAIFIMWNFVCFVFIALGQLVIYRIVQESQRFRKGRTTTDMNIARKLSFIVLTDFVCWFPICVMGMMALQGYVINSEVYAWVAVLVLPVNSALNPIIYTMSSFSSMRKRNLQKTNTYSSTTRSSSVQPKTILVSLMKRELLCLSQPPQTVCLSSHMKGVMTASDIMSIVRQVAVSMKSLHTSGLVSGGVDADSVYIYLDNAKRVTKVITSYVPMATDNEDNFSNDVFEFGQLVSTILKAFTVGKRCKGQGAMTKY